MDGFPSRISVLVGGLVIWAVHFGLVYGFTGLACARGWAPDLLGLGLVPVFTISATLVALLALLAMAIVAGRSHPAAGEVGFDNPGRDRDPETGHFVRVIGVHGAIYAALAVVFTTVPVLTTNVCA